MSSRGAVAPPLPKACSACPWRVSNQGTRHPGGWYTKANLRRLWAGMRRGEAMTCHPTDPENPVPEGWPSPPAAAQTHECCGATILQQREFMRLQDDYGADIAAYRRARPRGLTKDGIADILHRFLFGGTPFGERGELAKPDLNDIDVQYEDALGVWKERTR